MDTPQPSNKLAPGVVNPGPDAPVGNESHYHSKKDRIFVRGIQGAYSLSEELKRLRAMPRVRPGKEIKFNDRPQAYTRHYVEPKYAITHTSHLPMDNHGPRANTPNTSHCN